VWDRLKSLLSGSCALEKERQEVYEEAKRTLQRMVEEGKITTAELEHQLELIRNGHVEPPAATA
jgi:hypothetical protein